MHKSLHLSFANENHSQTADAAQSETDSGDVPRFPSPTARAEKYRSTKHFHAVVLTRQMPTLAASGVSVLQDSPPSHRNRCPAGPRVELRKTASCPRKSTKRQAKSPSHCSRTRCDASVFTPECQAQPSAIEIKQMG